MNYQLIWQSSDVEVLVALADVTLGFITYYFIAFSEKIKVRFFEKYPKDVAQKKLVFFQRYTGLLCLGIIPGAITWIITQNSPIEFGINFQNLFPSLSWIIGLGLVILLINFLNARKEDNLRVYPQIRVSEWTISLFLQNAFSWVAYLIAYEYLFRGLLLFGTSSLGILPAIVLNACIYAFAHLPKGIKETVGSIPLGLLLSYLTLVTGNIWIALGVHITLALSNDLFSLYFHPDMNWKK